MGAEYLIDTNIIIEFSAKRMPKAGIEFVSGIIDNNPQISIINKIELFGFSVVSKAVIDFVDYSIILPLSNEVSDQTITLRKEHKIKLPDAIIAATAIVFDLSLLTRNTKDFKGINGLRIINPHDL